MNKYIVNLPNPVVATDDTNVVTGITGKRWIGTKPDNKGATGNYNAGNGFIYSNAIVENKTDTALTKIVTLNILDLTAGNDNGIQVDLAALEFSNDVTILGIIGLGVVDKNAHATLISYPDFLKTLDCSVVRNSLIINVPNGQQDNVKNKSLNIMIYYR